MNKNFPVTPFPLLGEIVHECAVRSGLVSSNSVEDSTLYANLKALKDDRKRPALRPAMLPLEVLEELEKCLAKYTGSEMYALLTFVQIRRALEHYALTIGAADVTLLTREQVVEEILWPTLFAAAAAVCLEPLDIIFHVADLKSLLGDEAPFGRFLRGICVQGAQDYRLVCEFRAQRHNIDPEHCRDTLQEWLDGINVPTLENCNDILEALGMSNDAGTRQWVLVARLLAKTSPEHRAHILNWMTAGSKLPVNVQFKQRRDAVAWRAGEKLNIGRDRPFWRIKEALYRSDVPRDPLQIEDMLERQRVTWEPIAEQTRHTLEWLWGRYLVLTARYSEGFERYQTAYEWGFGRDRDVVQHVVNEMAALAGKLGKWRAAEKYRDIASMYGQPEWDGNRDSIRAFFDRQFPPELFFFVGPMKPAVLS